MIVRLVESKITHQYIDTSTTGVSYYNDLIPGSKYHAYMKIAKGLSGEIVMMSPDKYISECAKKIFKVPVENVLRGLSDENIDEYAKKMKSGTKFYMPYLNYTTNNQEGRHRVLALKKLGVKSLPVLVVKKYKMPIELPKSVKRHGNIVTWVDQDGMTQYDSIPTTDEKSAIDKLNDIISKAKK